MPEVYIIYSSYFDYSVEKPSIGGIQTYITELCAICQELNLSTHIIQSGDRNLKVIYRNTEIIQYKLKGKDLKEELSEKAKAIVKEEDIVIFATDTLIAEKTRFMKAIAIQHGVFWDIPNNSNRTKARLLLSNAIRSLHIIKRLDNVDTVVCVDYNFLNWYRTQVDKISNDIVIVPNYSKIPINASKDQSDKVRIIFARRLIEYRGTRVFTEAIVRILDEFENVAITIAGSGPDKKWMQDKLGHYSNVKFIEYESEESLSIHLEQDIAVVPTIGSEGTSLSLLEAMASKCAVICTDVGGMTNIVIDGYNGLMIEAGNVNALYNAVKLLVTSRDLIIKLSEKGYETISCAFSYDNWKNKWKRIISKRIYNLPEHW